MELKETTMFRPYNDDGSCALKTTGAGVYEIYHEGDLLYIGVSRSDVKKTLYRHFQKWTDRRNEYRKKMEPFARVTYYGMDRQRFLVRVVFCKDGNDAESLEKSLIRLFQPPDNKAKMEHIELPKALEDISDIILSPKWEPACEENPF